MEPWERQPGESAKAFHAFTHYRDFGPERSLDGAYRQHAQECMGQHPGNKRAAGRWTWWYSEWRWVSRVPPYDADLDRQQRERRQREILEARDRHANLSRLMQNKFLERMRDLNAAEIAPAVLVQMIRVATDIELRSLGESTESITIEQRATHEDEVWKRIVNNPAARELAFQLLAEVAAGADESGGAGLDG